MKNILLALIAALLVLGLSATSAHANVVINGTRVVFPAEDGEVTLRLENHGNQPALVQAWIDRGNPQSSPDTSTAPFLITPPLFRIEPHKSQSLRIIYTHENLPGDRESLFWLNVLEIPPKPTAAQVKDRNYLQLAIRSRLKVFFRPAGLAGDPLKAPQKVTWNAVAKDGGWVLRVHNPTPYHITFSKVQFKVGGTIYTSSNGMVAPMSDLDLDVKGLAAAPASGTVVDYDTINDFGAASAFKGTISP